MVKAGMDPRNMTYQALIDHLVVLEAKYTTSSPNKEGASGGNANMSRLREITVGKVIHPTRINLENPKKVDLKSAIFVSFLSQNQTPTKHTTLQSVKVGNIIKNYGYGEDQMSCNYKNQKNNSYARKSHRSAIAKEIKRTMKRREAGYISSQLDSSKSS